MIKLPKVSVIIPCFNSENFVNKAIQSCLDQSLKNIEIILIDDGSSDQTLSILKQYQALDKRVKVIKHNQNIGLGAARNTGIKAAQGEFIFFLDSDDYIHLNALEVLYSKAKQENLDILQAQYIRHENKSKTLLPENLQHFTKPISGIEYFHQGVFIEPKACGKLWHKDFLKRHKLFFDKGYYEDMAMVLQAFSIAKRVNNSLFAAYHYIIHPKSITNSPANTKHVQGMKNSLNRMQVLFEHKTLTEKTSVFPMQYFLYLKELAFLNMQIKDRLLQAEVRKFIKNQTKKYASFLKGNQSLPWLKRLILQQSPCIYARIKAILS